MTNWRAITPLAALLLLAGCGASRGVDPHLDGSNPDRLSEWGLFTVDAGRLRPAPGVVPYELNTTLFSDYADKSRTVWMPHGQAAAYRAEGAFEYPVGTILTKTFSFIRRDGAPRLVETRIIVRRASGWAALEYVWNQEQTDARLDVAPRPAVVTRLVAEGKTETFNYVMPNGNQCSACHDGGTAGAVPLGPTARNLNRGDQLARWSAMGYLTGVPAAPPKAPAWDDPASGSVGERAREYLDVNCASCHRPGTKAARNGVLLRASDPDPDGCQGGAIADRMATMDPEKKMPLIGHDVVHREAVSLIRDWAATLKPCYNR